jgi:spoIIIJ-associated protein
MTMSQTSRVEEQIREFVEEILEEMGLDLDVNLEPMDDGLRVDLTGDDAEPILRRKGEALDALQHVVSAAFRDALGGDRRIVLDCQGFRKAKDREVQQIARFMMEKVRSTGLPQEIGPLNSYARRLVHLEVATAPDLASESQGDGAVKTVIISRRT